MKYLVALVLVAWGCLYASATAEVETSYGGYGSDHVPYEHDWPQWAQSSTHHGYLPIRGQALKREFLRFQYGKQGMRGVGCCEQTWGMTAFAPNCETGTYEQLWVNWVDWKAAGSLNDWWEPVFHGAFAGDFLYVPAAKGGVHKMDPETGKILRTYTPVAGATNQYVTASPLTVDKLGRIYYTVVAFEDPAVPNAADILGSWLVVIPTRKVAYGTDEPVRVADITTMAKLPADGLCQAAFSESEDPPALPYPPSPDAVPPRLPCGKLRAGINAGPAVGHDGTVVLALRAHFVSRESFVVALHPDLSVKWATSLRERFADGCGVPGGVLPPNGQPGGCREGAKLGVDPDTSTLGGGQVVDTSSASPVIGPDGSVFYGAYTRYNYYEGHLMKFAPDGEYVTAYKFGWDTTPGIYVRESPYGGRFHDAPSYSLITKENHYGGFGSYCDDETFCPVGVRPANSPEAYYMTQLSSDLQVQWQWQNTNHFSCTRQPDNSVTCVEDHPNGFEWCVNAPAIDKDGTIYVNSEDGWLYKIAQGGVMVDKFFQQQALGAAYTPASLDPDGLVLTQNTGTLFIVGETLCGGKDYKS